VKGQLIPTTTGPVFIWRPPEKGEDYVLAADSSEGVRGGDFAAGVVLRMRDCALCCLLHGLIDATEWGKKVSRVAWHYNEALVGFETYPTAHGLSAARSAVAYGYTRLYNRVVSTAAVRELTDKLGWHTDVRSKAIMVDAVRVAIANGYEIPSQALLLELLRLKYDQNSKIVTDDHDDIFDAYAIGLCIREEAFARGSVRQSPARYTSFEDWHLAQVEASLGGEPGSSDEQLFDGI
jgi:hypothetical protein